MSWEYSCPECKAMLNPDRTIMLAMQKDDVRLLIGLHPQPGKYEILLPPEIAVEDGTKWNFSCPVCQARLANKNDPDLCELELRMDDGSVKVLFSRIAGEHATFILNESTLKEKHGKNSDRYDLNFGQSKYLV